MLNIYDGSGEGNIVTDSSLPAVDLKRKNGKKTVTGSLTNFGGSADRVSYKTDLVPAGSAVYGRA